MLGAEVGGGFGTTESCMGAGFVPGLDDERAWTSDGVALANVSLRVVDDDGRELPPGTEGNFEIGTDTLFAGYLHRPADTAAAITEDGWYRPGDLATIDVDGYLRITGRVKDVINRGGEKVPVAEIEQLLYEHPAVAEVAIVAMADERLGERACAFVVPRTRTAVSASRRCRRIWTSGVSQSRTGQSGSSSSQSCRGRHPARSRSSCCASRRAGSPMCTERRLPHDHRDGHRPGSARRR